MKKEKRHGSREGGGAFMSITNHMKTKTNNDKRREGGGAFMSSTTHHIEI
jgi:hypothetical protein